MTIEFGDDARPSDVPGVGPSSAANSPQVSVNFRHRR